MKSTTRLSILRVEGLPQDHSSLGCYITINNLLLDIVTPLSRPSHCELTPQSRDATLRLVVRYMGKEDHVVGVVAVPLSLLPEGKQTWLPLRRGNERELVTSLQSEVKFPRILVVVDGLESESKRPEKRSKICLLIPSRPDDPETPPNPLLAEIQSQKLRKQQALIQDFSLQITEMQSALERQKQQESTWQELFKDMNQATAASMSLTITREKEMRQLLTEYERKCAALQAESMKAKSAVLMQESELQVLREEAKLLRAENFVLKSELQDKQLLSENISLRLQIGTLRKRLAAFQATLRSHSSPAKQIDSAAPSPTSPSTTPQSESFLDLALSELFHGAQPPMVKLSLGVYSIDGEPVAISFRSGMLVVKVKGGYLLLSEYLRLKDVEMPKDEDCIIDFPISHWHPALLPVPSPIQDVTKSDLISEEDLTFRTDLFELLREIDPVSPIHRLRHDKRNLLKKCSKSLSVEAHTSISILPTSPS